MTAQTNQQKLHTVIEKESIPAATINNRTARIWDRVADRYAAKPIADEATYARKLAITREYLHLQASVLELGCGTGSTALAHAKYVKHIKAIDVSSRMIEIAKSKAAIANISNVDFVHMDVDDVHLPEASLDVVLMLNLLHLLADWRQHIAMTYHRLKPGGVFVSSTLCLNDDFAFMRVPAAAGRIIRLLPQLSFFTRNELEYALTDAGFEVKHASQPARKTAVFLVARKPA